MSEPAILRSWLFVPGDSERKQAKALDSGADALILDLEDSIAPGQIPAARVQVRKFLQSAVPRQSLWVRVNAPSSEHFQEDLRAVIAARPRGIVLPKVSTAAEISAADSQVTTLESSAGLASGSIKFLIIATETPHALFNLQTFAAASPRVMGLTWGHEDLAVALGAKDKFNADGSLAFSFQLARSLCLFAAAAANIAAIDGVHTEFRDRKATQDEAERAYRDGFVGKLAIHPEQILQINAAFVPSAAEVEHARKIVAAFAATPNAGVIGLDGRMFDRPHLVQAQRVLALAVKLCATARV